MQNSVTSIIECVNIHSGRRQALYREANRLEAPNWSRDGSFLVYNCDGVLYRLQLDNNKPQKLDTSFANANNNDHGISPDGTQLVISHHAAECDGQSIIYTLPIGGGNPKQITKSGPSYWHGWSPDGKTLAFVAGRGKPSDFDIYTIGVDGGEEVQLTHTPGLDDGPDYSADGRYIYFNSYRSGRMQIWRMHSDGTNPQQVVESPNSDWFPHPSPDGKYLVFLRYLQDQLQSHPFGRDVQLILLDLQSRVQKPLTEIFWGGQGTINVPSWSPDSQSIAFISYIKME